MTLLLCDVVVVFMCCVLLVGCSSLRVDERCLLLFVCWLLFVVCCEMRGLLCVVR